MNLEPIRTGVAMTWESLDERERRFALYALAWLVIAIVGLVQRHSRESLRREIVEELATHGAGSRE